MPFQKLCLHDAPAPPTRANSVRERNSGGSWGSPLPFAMRGENKTSSFYNKKGSNLSGSFAVWETDSPPRGLTTFMLTHTGKTAPAGHPHAAWLANRCCPSLVRSQTPAPVTEVLRPDDKAEATRLSPADFQDC